jgi:outer membrane protein OmpA-like peptidoglycan-associated protein
MHHDSHMKFALIILAVSLNTFGQTGTEIYGRVFALQIDTRDTLLLKNASIYIQFGDSSRIKETTDENGAYRFLMKGSKRPMRLYAIANSQTFCKAKNQYCFISDGLYRVIPTTHHSGFKVDFEFKQFTGCRPVPPELAYLVSIMRRYSSMRILVQGHADSKERHPRALSRKRARQVYKTLLKNGIDKKRLSYKSFGGNTPLIPEQIIANAPSAEERVALQQKNSRVTFRVLEFGIQ